MRDRSESDSWVVKSPDIAGKKMSQNVFDLERFALNQGEKSW
jgi:hypothetical protein